jgi:ribosomal protein S12 methylthiotransferase accessory factor YcaO
MPVMVTLPQLVTTAVTVLAAPITTVSQLLLTPRHGASVTTQVALAVLVTEVLQGLKPMAVTVSGKLPQVFVTDLVSVAVPPGANEAIVPIDP